MPPPVEAESSALGIGTIGGIVGGTLGFIICIALPLALWLYRRNMLEKARISPTFAQELVDRASVGNGNAGKLARRTLGTKGLEARRVSGHVWPLRDVGTHPTPPT